MHWGVFEEPGTIRAPKRRTDGGNGWEGWALMIGTIQATIDAVHSAVVPALNIVEQSGGSWSDSLPETGLRTRTTHTLTTAERGFGAGSRHRRNWDPSTPKGRKRQKKVAQMVEMHHQGATYEEIAERYGISKRHVGTLLRSPLNLRNNVQYDPDVDYCSSH